MKIGILNIIKSRNVPHSHKVVLELFDPSCVMWNSWQLVLDSTSQRARQRPPIVSHYIFPSQLEQQCMLASTQALQGEVVKRVEPGLRGYG